MDAWIARDEKLLFRAVSERSGDMLLGMHFEGELFLLQVKKKKEDYLIKSDGLTRPLEVNKLKRALLYLAQEAELNVLYANTAFSPSKPSLAEQFSKSIKDFESPAFSGKNVAIEVGFGSGRHLIHQAKKNPDTLFIGIEIHTPSAQQVLKQIALQKIDNVWVVNYDARLLLEMMPSNSCSDIFVHFPVPWDKKPHRRVISASFLSEALRVLAPKGRLELRTDSERYYRYVLEVFSAPGEIHFTVEKNKEIAIRSKYEERWRAQHKDIYTLTVHTDVYSEEARPVYNFAFAAAVTKDPKSLVFPMETQVEDGFFVHYEERFMIVGQEGILVKISFGSFDRPEHKYLMLTDGKARYYPQDPVRTETNYHAHQKIGECIYG